MAFLDQDQPIDYSNRYNENTGSISPRASTGRPNHSTNNAFKPDTDQLDTVSTYSTMASQFGDLHNSNHSGATASFGSDFSNFNSLFQNTFSQTDSPPNDENNFNQNNQQSSMMNVNCLGQGFEDRAYLFDTIDAPDSTIAYQTEDTPIQFSNMSSVSSLSLEQLPTIEPIPEHPSSIVHPISTFKNGMYETVLNSSGDSLTHYDMENSPYCLSYDSPSPLSLDLNSVDGELTPETVELFNSRILKQQQQTVEQDITSMLSGMSIDRSTRSSNERLNKKEPLKFGQLNDGEDFILLDLDMRQSKSEQFDGNQPSPGFLNSQKSVVSHHQQSQSQDRNSDVDLENGSDKGFEIDINEEDSTVNQLISFGRLPNSKNASTDATTNNQLFVAQQSAHPLYSKPSHSRQFSSSPVTHPPQPAQPREHVHRPEEIPFTNYPEGQLPFNRKDLLKFKQREVVSQQQAQNRTGEKFINHSAMHYEPASSKQQPFIVQPSSPLPKAMPSNKQFVNLDDDSDTAITISSDFLKKYSSRENYLIDGEEEDKQFSSVPFAPIIELHRHSEFQQATQRLKHELAGEEFIGQKLFYQSFANQQSPMKNQVQVKPKGFKKIFKAVSKQFKNL